MISAGLDIGAVSTEAVIIDNEKNVLSYVVIRTGSNSRKATEEVIRLALAKAKLSFNDINSFMTTGYGRKAVSFKSNEISEISCHARGAHFLFPKTSVVIDIGGQDSKAIRLNNNGEAVDFSMNDKCAAGTGRFLEEMAKTLDTTVENLGELSSKSRKTLVISSMCTVFAESEVVSLLAEGQNREDIAKALHGATADRVLSLANKIRLTNEITLTGGVAKNMGIVDAIRSRLLNMTLNIPEEAQIVGALGAALIALDLKPEGS